MVWYGSETVNSLIVYTETAKEERAEVTLVEKKNILLKASWLLICTR